LKWNALTDKEKNEYIAAELCLMSHPPVTGLVENATNVWDELANAHINQGNDIRKLLPAAIHKTRLVSLDAFSSIGLDWGL
jgi:hypothetical protein